jgi:hypothetical protein
MTNLSAPRRTPGGSTRPGLAAFVGPLLALILLSAGLLVAGCGSGAGGTDATTAPPETGATSTTFALEEVTPDGLATAVTDTWAEAMQEMVALLEGRPEAAAILPEVQALKEEYIQRLVELGHQRETLSAADDDRANNLEMLAFNDMADETWYAAYNKLWSYYADMDLDLANLMGSFNYLTQYSDFELLKEQAPAEADRLGIE